MFERDWDGDRSRVLDKPVGECAWVFAGEGIATQKYDGTSCLIRDGVLYKRLALSEGRICPEGFISVEWEGEEGARKLIGWTPVGDGPEDRWHRQAFEILIAPTDGTYELVGPQVQNNPEGLNIHCLWRHSNAQLLDDAPRAFAEFAEFFSTHDVEGIVWHHLDGRMAKIKARDFGIKRGGK